MGEGKNKLNNTILWKAIFGVSLSLLLFACSANEDETIKTTHVTSGNSSRSKTDLKKETEPVFRDGESGYWRIRKPSILYHC